MGRSLYEIGAELAAVERAMESEDLTREEQEQIVSNWLACAEGEVTAKVDGYLALIANYAAMAEGRKREGNRMLQLAKRDEARAKGLRDRLADFMALVGHRALRTPRFTVSLVANGGKAGVRVPQFWEEVVPAKYHAIRIVTELDEDALRADLEAGVEVAGCELLPRGRHLVVR